MCQTNKRTYGIELEGYTNTNIRGKHLEGWTFIGDGSLEDGREDCDYCNGIGERDYECSVCWGSGREDCEECGGSGEIDCDKCDGSNSIECSYCDGCGYDDEDNECEHCNGDGSFECDECDNYGCIECSDCNGHGDITCCHCEGDGEIREECDDCGGSGYYGDGDGYGVECVSGICNEGDFTPIDKVFDFIKWNWTVNSDCGTHVHIGASDLKAVELSKLAILMNIVEPMIYGSLDTDRIEGNFAKMVDRDMVEYLILKGDTITEQELANKYYNRIIDLNGHFHKYDHARYHGLNLHSWFLRETIEFRYFEGTESREQAKEWIDLCIKLVDFAKYTTFEQLRVIGQDFYVLQDLGLQLGKLETLLGLEYNIRPFSNYAYEKAMRNVALGLRPTTNISQAVYAV